MDTMLHIDGAVGEGGGQVLRTALTLALVTGKAIAIDRIRAGRAKPGLLRQHLAAVRLAQQVSNARVDGDEVGSCALRFAPGRLRGGNHAAAVGSAGSATLVLQTVVPALVATRTAATLRVEGGTHNPAAPPFPFLEHAYLPLLRRMGGDVSLELLSHGFYPAGGGAIEAVVGAGAPLRPLTLIDRGAPTRRNATASVALLPRVVAERELVVVGRALGWADEELTVDAIRAAAGPGNTVALTCGFENVTEVFVAFGERRLRAEAVARQAVDACLAYQRSGAAVGEHLADQLLLLCALAGGGTFTTTTPTLHARTQALVIPMFLPVRIDFVPEAEDRVRVDVAPA
jgi:RNA 3'-terminal phosphate cyclase (ATP)